jgi:hypothetical protein
LQWGRGNGNGATAMGQGRLIVPIAIDDQSFSRATFKRGEDAWLSIGGKGCCWEQRSKDEMSIGGLPLRAKFESGKDMNVHGYAWYKLYIDPTRLITNPSDDRKFRSTLISIDTQQAPPLLNVAPNNSPTRHGQSRPSLFLMLPLVTAHGHSRALPSFECCS